MFQVKSVNECVEVEKDKVTLIKFKENYSDMIMMNLNGELYVTYSSKVIKEKFYRIKNATMIKFIFGRDSHFSDEREL